MYVNAIGPDPSSHHFLTVDKNAKDNDRVFRRNFNEILVIEHLQPTQLIEKAKKKQKVETSPTSDVFLDDSKNR